MPLKGKMQLIQLISWLKIFRGVLAANLNRAMIHTK
jgi:hypothetical protein